MPRPYHRRHPHCPPGYVTTVALAAETGWTIDRVRRIAKQHGLVVYVLTDLFVHRHGFLELLKPTAAPSPASPDQAA